MLSSCNVNIGKQRVAAKSKALRAKYRSAVDSGKRSGGGRLVMMYYDLCVQLWSGSPAATSISEGIETRNASSPKGDDERRAETPSMQSDTPDDHEQTPTEFAEFLAKRRTSRMVTKLSQDQQLKQMQREELAIKRQMVNNLEETDKSIAASMDKMAKTIDTFANAMVKMADAMTSGLSNQPGTRSQTSMISPRNPSQTSTIPLPTPSQTFMIPSPTPSQTSMTPPPAPGQTSVIPLPTPSQTAMMSPPASTQQLSYTAMRQQPTYNNSDFDNNTTYHPS